MDKEAEIDQCILAALKDGDRKAFADLYDRHASWLLAVAYRILQNRRDAEDLLHDVFMEVWRKAASYNPGRGTVRSWLAIRVRSRALDRIRAVTLARKHALLESTDESQLEASDDDISGAVDHKHARRAVAGLSLEQRTVIELSYFQGFSCSEIAEHCSFPIGTVKSRLAAAMVVLRKQLITSEDGGKCR